MTTALALVVLMLAVGMVVMTLVHRADQEVVQRLQREAYVDDLTGLPNRRSLMFAMNALASTDQTWSLAIIDVDDFKAINDTFGHVAGDAALAGIADILLGGNWMAARLGGDEFAVVFSQDVISAAAALQNAIRRIIVVDPATGSPFSVTLSVGLAAHEPGSPLTMLLHNADCALYQAKRSGREIAIAGMGAGTGIERSARLGATLSQEWDVTGGMPSRLYVTSVPPTGMVKHVS